MILKKPYAFLIKFFKAIHIVMFLSFSYLAFVLRNIYLFFSRYVKNGTFTYFNNMKGMYTSIFIIILIIILLIINLIYN